MKSARKMRMIPERDDIFGGNPKLQFNFYWLTVHGELLRPANGMIATLYPNADFGASVRERKRRLR
ncbi:MAG: hypothetical protein WBW99_08545, partial [Pseudolabrys sp.]